MAPADGRRWPAPPRPTSTARSRAGAQPCSSSTPGSGALSPDDYRDLRAAALARASSARLRAGHAGHPLRHRHGDAARRSMREAGGDVIGLDWRVDLDRGWSAGRPRRRRVQGNLDPAALLGAAGGRSRERARRSSRAPAAARATSSTSATASSRARRSSTWARSSTWCTSLSAPVIDAVLLDRVRRARPRPPRSGRSSTIVTRGRRIPPERLEEVAHHYEQMPGGRSPLQRADRGTGGRPARGALVARGKRAAGVRRHAQLASVPARDAGGDGRARPAPRARHHPVVASHRGLVGSLPGGRGGARASARPARPDRVYAPPWFEHPALRRPPWPTRVGQRAGARARRRARGHADRLHRPQRAGGDGRGLALRRRLHGDAARAVAGPARPRALVARLPEPQRQPARSVAGAGRAAT